MTIDLYDPLTYDNLMAGLVMHYAKTTKERLDTLTNVEGPGIYSLYYSGGFPAYGPISGKNTPIYVGKAVPPGSRKGGRVDETSPALQRRIREHSKSIGQATNLAVADFSCRHLSVVSVWITLAERFLIDYYKPVWNLCLDGFGDHDPGRGRRNSQKSWWDTLHPGRQWAYQLVGGKTVEEAEKLVTRFLSQSVGDDR